MTVAAWYSKQFQSDVAIVLDLLTDSTAPATSHAAPVFKHGGPGRVTLRTA